MNNEKSNDYLFLFRGTDWTQGLSPEQLQTVMTQFKGWFDRLSAEGVIKGASPLKREGRMVTAKKGIVADGPFAESKESIAGYFLVQADSLDAATALARQCPTLAHGAIIEVRPIAEICPSLERLQQTHGLGELAHTAA